MQYTFLDLVQMVARESGTVPGNMPETVQSQIGRLSKIAFWVNLAWEKIQNHHAYWNWMHGEFTGVTSPGLSEYSPIQFGLTRFARWVNLPDTLTIYKQDLGKDDEQFIQPIGFTRFKRLYGIGNQENSRPACFTVTYDDMLSFGPTPDDEYVVRGEYYKSIQQLVNDGDLPELPLRHRPVIAWYALLLLSEHDEGGTAMATSNRRYREALGDLERDQLPSFEIYRRLRM